MRGFAERDEHRRELRTHGALRTGSVCEWQRGKLESGDTDESNVLLGVPITIPGPSEAKETEDTAEVESKGCQSGTGVRACEGCWKVGRQDRDVYLNARNNQ